MSICDKCIHTNVCSAEGAFDKALTYCNDFLSDDKDLFKKASASLDFANWVAKEIFDDLWEFNKDAFAEIACRKLSKLGIVRENGNEWELVEQEESEDEDDTNKRQ